MKCHFSTCPIIFNFHCSYRTICNLLTITWKLIYRIFELNSDIEILKGRIHFWIAFLHYRKMPIRRKTISTIAIFYLLKSLPKSNGSYICVIKEIKLNIYFFLKKNNGPFSVKEYLFCQ